MGSQTFWGWVHGTEGEPTKSHPTRPLSSNVNVERSLTRESPNSLLPRWMGSRIILRCASANILWLGGLKSSKTAITVDLDTSGQIRCSPMYSSDGLRPRFSFHWGAEQIRWHIRSGCRDDGAKVRCKPLIPMNCG